jgi:hypothetical protein
MTPHQRQAAFERLLSDLARERARKLGVGCAGTIRKLPPPPLPGERPGATRYFLNAVESDGSRTGLVELAGADGAALRRAEAWASTGKGPVPARPASRGKPRS